MKITVEPSQGVAFNPENGESREVGGMRVEWQEKLGGSRKHATIMMDRPASSPQDMLRAAAAYFEAQEAS